MSEMRDKMEDFIKSYYEERHSEVVITKRIASRLYDTLYNENLEWNCLSDSEQRACCGELLNRDYIIKKEMCDMGRTHRQMNRDDKSKDTV